MAPKTLLRFCLAVAALGMTTSIGTPARAAENGEPIPTQLLNSPGVEDLNGPCSLCRVTSLKAAEGVAGSKPTLDLYFEDERGTLSGSLELTVLLHSGALHIITLEDITLAYREHTVFELPLVEQWDWNNDVHHLWVEPIPAEPTP